MKLLFFLTFLSLFGLFADAQNNRGFTPVVVPDAGGGNLYEYSYALVIGESEYTNGWQRLNGVKSDVPEVTRALEAQGFFVVVKENIKSEDFDRTVKAFIAEYCQNVNSRVIIYYAGHGHTIKNQLTNGSMGYVVPVDAPNPAYDKAGFLTKAVDMNQFNNYALQIQAKHTLFLFDACFAGTIFSGRAGVPPAIDYSTAQPVRQFITSGDENEVVADASTFRREFVNALTSPVADADKDGYLTASELSLYLYTQVANNSNGTQHPISGKLKNAAYNKGDFVFVLGNITPPNPDIDDGQQVNATGNLKLITDYTGTAKITSISGTQLQTKSVSAGSTYDFYSLPAGVVIINIYSGSSVVWTQKVMITSGQTTTIHAQKEEPTNTTLTIYSNPSGASVYIDDVFYGTTPYTVTLNFTNYSIKLDAGADYEVYKKTASISKTTTRLDYTLTKKQLTPIPPDNNSGIEPTMILVKGGTFQMGSNDGDSDEKPVHSVTVSDFYMGKYEVTVAEFESFVNATGYKTQDEKDGKGYIYDGSNWTEVSGKNWRHDVAGNIQTNKRHPVIRVSWEDATAYCDWLSKETGKTYRLPTEAEWEYVARGGVETRLGVSLTYAGSYNIDEVAWYWDNAGKKTHQVGTKSPNALGLYDMSGNVWEWCSDWYGSYTSSSKTNPTGASSGSGRVIRGGSWSYGASLCRVASRGDGTPSDSDSDIGFRVCREY